MRENPLPSRCNSLYVGKGCLHCKSGVLDFSRCMSAYMVMWTWITLVMFLRSQLYLLCKGPHAFLTFTYHLSLRTFTHTNLPVRWTQHPTCVPWASLHVLFPLNRILFLHSLTWLLSSCDGLFALLDHCIERDSSFQSPWSQAPALFPSWPCASTRTQTVCRT